MMQYVLRFLVANLDLFVIASIPAAVLFAWEEHKRRKDIEARLKKLEAR